MVKLVNDVAKKGIELETMSIGNTGQIDKIVAGDLSLELVQGEELKRYLDDLSRLRLNIFKEYPYLYAGTDPTYERAYVEGYFKDSAFFVIATDRQGRVVGMGTCISMHEADPEFQRPFEGKGFDLEKMVYIGEVLLEQEYRRDGNGSIIMGMCERYATPKYTHASLSTVVREKGDLREPVEYSSSDPFWEKHGYTKRDDITAQYPWIVVGDDQETTHDMAFWVKRFGR